ncbi:hypothetical protein AX16_005713 [Volvariella volvacea WC 439]|nr:hypothetical protein AX16_005713 [Volvariella volvacea WC 439]
MSSILFYEPFYNFDRFFDEAFNQLPHSHNASRAVQSNDGAVRHFKPRMDLHENAEQNLVTATFELPGMKKEDIAIDLHDGRLTISGENEISSEYEENGYTVRERRFGKFSRTLQLPQGVKAEEVRASIEDGVLTVTFLKTAPELAPKKITIS